MKSLANIIESEELARPAHLSGSPPPDPMIEAVFKGAIDSKLIMGGSPTECDLTVGEFQRFRLLSQPYLEDV
jgi:hypothetical protein